MTDSETRKPGPPRLALGDASAVRRSLARIIRERFRGSIDSERFRDLVYGLNTLLGYDRHLADLRIEDRLNTLEAALVERDATKSKRIGPGALSAPESDLLPEDGAPAVSAQTAPVALESPEPRRRLRL